MQKTIIKSTILFSIFTIFTQVLAVLRDIALVRFVGVGPLLDTYYMAFKIPDLLSGFYMIFLGSVVFIPIITKALYDGGIKEVQDKISEISSFILSMIIFISILIFIFMPYLVNLFAGYLPLSQQLEMVSLSRLLLISQLIFPIGIVAGAICMTHGKSVYVAISSTVYNLGILLGVIILYPYFGLMGLGMGVIFGAVLFTVVQTMPAEVRSVLKGFRFRFNFKLIKEFIKKNNTRFISVFAWQVFLLLLVFIASSYGPDSVSVWSIAYGIEVSIIAIIGTAIASILMPIFSKSHEEGNVENLKENITNATIYSIWLGSIVSILLFFTSLEFIKLLFYFANLDEVKAASIAFVFSILILSLPMQNYFEILRKYLYARDMIKAVSALIILFMFFVLVFIYTFDYLSLSLGLSYIGIYSIAFAFLFANIFSISIFSKLFKLNKYIDYKKVWNYLNSILLTILLTASIYFILFHILFSSLEVQGRAIFTNNILYLFIFKILLLTLSIIIFSYLFKDKVFIDFIEFVKFKLKK